MELGDRKGVNKVLGGMAARGLGLTVPALIKGLQGTNTMFAGYCAEQLGKRNVDAELVVPELAKVLGSSDKALILRSSEALSLKGTHAKAAVPELMKLRTDPDPMVRGAAIEAVMKIAPEALRANADSSTL